MKKPAASDMSLAAGWTIARVQMLWLSGSHTMPNRNPAQRLRFGKEEQRHERAPTLKKVGASDIELAPTCVRTSKSDIVTLIFALYYI